MCVKVVRQKKTEKKYILCILLFYQRWSWGSISDRRPFGVDTALCSSCSRSAPPRHLSLRCHHLPLLRPLLHHRFPPPLPPHACFSSLWFLPKKGQYKSNGSWVLLLPSIQTHCEAEDPVWLTLSYKMLEGSLPFTPPQLAGSIQNRNSQHRENEMDREWNISLEWMLE